MANIHIQKLKKISNYIIVALLIGCYIFTSQTRAATVENFSRHLEYYNIKISPDGKHLAALVNVEGDQSLVFLDAKTYEVIYILHSKEKNQPASYYWVNNERVIIQLAQLRGSLEKPINYGELYAINYNGKKGKMIFGYRSKSLSAHAGFLVDILKGDDENVLITKRPFSLKSDVLSQVIKLNVYSGKETRVRIAPIPYSQFLIDNDGQPRFVAGVDDNYNVKLFYSKGKESKWQAFGEEFSGEFTPVAFSTDNNSVYALKSEKGEAKGLYKYNLETKEESLLYKSKMVDPTNVIQSNANSVFGLRLDEDYPSYIYLDNDNEEAKIHKALYAAFKGSNINITSKTEDGSTIIVQVNSDINPGTFYSFNTKTMQAKHLFKSASWIKPEEMSQVEPFRIKTPDGLTLNGFLTIPKNKTKNLPTVVLPHGGPHARDYWRFDPQVQMLANAGYAVVQVNFRGSEGYGKNFMEAGYKNWGSKIQDDILLAANYAIQEGIADKDRVCIFGTSFGGYSALQSAIRTPELFKCAIGYAGVYDLPMLYEEGDITSLKWGDAFLDKTLGTDIEQQRENSPVYHVDKLKAPVLIIHGENDQRAPIEHAEKLKKALDKDKHPYEWLVKDKEGHGFYNEVNILEANKAILSFLEKHIGK
jgi:dipeptidyl aminopeptidase/acylaminoacyl peptidase